MAVKAMIPEDRMNLRWDWIYLFPLDGCRRLGGDVVGYAVDAANFVDDLVRYFSQEVVGQMGPVGGHGVGRSHGAERHGTFVGAFVAHDAYALNRKEDGSCLPHFVIEVPVTEPLDEDMVGFLQDGNLFGGDVAEDTHCKSGTGEGMTGDEAFWHSEFAAHGAHFVFEEQAQRFAEFQVHLLGQSAYVVVALDCGSGD